MKKPLNDEQLIKVAHNLEAQAIWSLTGTQDYIPALKKKGGINIIDYSPQGFSIKTILEGVKEMFENIFIIYTGEPHHSGLNNWEDYSRCFEQKGVYFRLFRGIGPYFPMYGRCV